jgi:tRNA-splicing ligase RtcB
MYQDINAIPNVRSWTSGVEVQSEALQQISHLACLPILAGPVAVMPDVHAGKGATVGSVIATRGAIIPACVGVDIGCGMCALQTDLMATDLPDSLMVMRSAIESAVPVGFACHDRSVSTYTDGLEGIALYRRSKNLRLRLDGLRLLERIGRYDTERVWKQLGTLGGGNHFIELCLDAANHVWVMLHSGSRFIGKTIGEIAIGIARERASRLHRHLPDRDLAWLDEGSTEFDEYVHALSWAQDYAAQNRGLMMHRVMLCLARVLGRDVTTVVTAVNCHHNYAASEVHAGERVWVTRKGAVSARAGQLGIIPGSMGARSYIVRGKGNTLSYESCSHGAGRRMSRGAAKSAFSVAELEAQTAGIECRKDEQVLDEIPGAYKDIDAVMRAQRDLVDIVHTLRQVLCVKG